jgi:imidazoleglycerol phosphate dehydratase HisB
LRRVYINNCGLNLRINQASFKAVALALRKACEIDTKQKAGAAISTKGLL